MAFVSCRWFASTHGLAIQAVPDQSLTVAAAAELFAFVWPFEASGRDESEYRRSVMVGGSFTLYERPGLPKAETVFMNLESNKSFLLVKSSVARYWPLSHVKTARCPNAMPQAHTHPHRE